MMPAAIGTDPVGRTGSFSHALGNRRRFTLDYQPITDISHARPSDRGRRLPGPQRRYPRGDYESIRGGGDSGRD